jgi:uncharacterized membrane protein
VFRPGEGDTRRERDRIVNLSNGVFAIAITLLWLVMFAVDVVVIHRRFR